MSRSKLLHSFVLVTLFAGLAALNGCGGASKCTVTGKVTYKGKPVYGGTITIMNEKDPPQIGSIELDGTYTVRDAPTGKVRIGVVSQKPQAKVDRGGDRMKSTAPQPVGEWFAIDEKYNDPNSSGKEMILKSGTNTIDIVLD